MSYIDRIAACNNHDPSRFLPLTFAGGRIGLVTNEFLGKLRDWPELFQLYESGVRYTPRAGSFAGRSEEMEALVKALLERQAIHRWHGEPYPVVANDREKPFFLVDRASVSYFGFKAFGQHLNGYVREGDRIKMWLARRSITKWNEPGKLDNMVAGGLPYGLSLAENLEKECWEEASIPPELAGSALQVGTIFYTADTTRGVKPDTIYCYDLELPADFVPRCTDGEVESFELLPIEEVAEIVEWSDDVKKNSNLVIIDFLLRHRLIKRDYPQYDSLLEGLNRQSG